MPSQIIKAACTYVAAHADLDRDLPFRKHAHQLGICICIQPVTNALGADVQRSPDRLRPRRLPGVCCEMQAMIFGLRVNFLEKLWRGSALVSADPNSNDVALLVLNCLVKYLGSGFNSEMADGRKNPEQRNSKIAFPAQSSSFKSLEHLIEILLPPLHPTHRDIHLTMQHVLRMQTLHELVGDQLKVFRSAQPLGYRLERHQEALKIGIAVQLLYLFE